MEFDGTLLLVSHDRTFIDNIVTSTLVFEGDGHIGDYVGGYEDWLRQRPVKKASTPAADSTPATDTKTQSPATPAQKQKLSYKEKRELESLPDQIEKLEQEKAAIEHQVGEAAFYQQDKTIIASTLQRLEVLGGELESCYQRWEELSEYE